LDVLFDSFLAKEVRYFWYLFKTGSYATYSFGSKASLGAPSSRCGGHLVNTIGIQL